MKKISSIFVCLSFLIFIGIITRGTSLIAEELILKVKESPTIAGWVYQKGELENSYCLYERNYMILASANVDIKAKNPILNIFKEHEADILSSSFSISNKRFISLDSEGMLIERMFADSSKVNIRKVHEKLKPACVAISPDDSVELVGFKNGFIQAHSLLKKAKKNVDVYFKAHSGSAYSISFNALGNYFISSSEDGKIKIWNSKDLSLIREIDAVKKDGTFFPVPATFSPLNDVFVYVSSEKMLAFSDIKGKNIDTVFVADGIKEVHFTEKKDAIAVITLMENLEFYSISTGKYLGTIPSLNGLSLSSLSINIVTGSLLVATSEGEIYLCKSDEIKNARIAKKKEETVKMVQTSQKDKGSALSKNVLEYWGLEEGVNVQAQVRKPFFSIKDETPLEAPISVVPPKEEKKNKKQTKIVKTIDQTIFDEEVEFQPVMQEDEDDSYDEEDESNEDESADTAQKVEATSPKGEGENQEDDEAKENEEDSNTTVKDADALEQEKKI